MIFPESCYIKDYENVTSENLESFRSAQLLFILDMIYLKITIWGVGVGGGVGVGWGWGGGGGGGGGCTVFQISEFFTHELSELRNLIRERSRTNEHTGSNARHMINFS